MASTVHDQRRLDAQQPASRRPPNQSYCGHPSVADWLERAQVSSARIGVSVSRAQQRIRSRLQQQRPLSGPRMAAKQAAG